MGTSLLLLTGLTGWAIHDISDGAVNEMAAIYCGILGVGKKGHRAKVDEVGMGEEERVVGGHTCCGKKKWARTG